MRNRRGSGADGLEAVLLDALDFVKARHGWMTVICRRRCIAGPHAQDGLHPGRFGCIELRDDVADEENFVWRKFHPLGDLAVALRFLLAADLRVVVATK